MSLVERLITDTSEDEYYQAFLNAQEYLHSLGITAWQEAILGDYAALDDPSSVYVRAAESGTLTARVRGALWWAREHGLEQVGDEVVVDGVYELMLTGSGNTGGGAPA